MSATHVAPHRLSQALAPAQRSLSGVLATRADGAWVEASDGRRYLDLISGIATLNLGHGHPRVTAAVCEQLERLVHSGGVLGHEPMLALADRLAEIAPGRIASFLFATTGSEATEVALRLARHATGRPGVVCFRGGFHGRTQGSLACTTSRAGFRTGPMAGGVAVAPFPKPFEWGVDADCSAEIALSGLDELHRHELLPQDTACYLIEPVQGQGGCLPASPRFLEGLRERADRHGALLVFDEIQTGFGRTGGWFAAHTYGVVPDVICLAKALGAGFPLSAVGGSPELMSRLPVGAHGSTFGGSPLSCAAALAGITALAEEGLVDRARLLGRRATRALRQLQARVPELADVRGPGLMIGLEFADPATRDPRPDLAEAVVAEAEREGLLLARSGPEGSVVRLLPPLILSDAELELGMNRLTRAIAAACDRSLSSGALLPVAA